MILLQMYILWQLPMWILFGSAPMFPMKPTVK